MALQYKTRIDIGFFVAAVLICSVLISVYASFRQMNHQKERVEHTYQVISALQDTISSLIDIQGSVRGYVITGMEDYLTPYYLALPRAENSLKRLRALITDNPGQLEREASLSDHVGQRLGIAKNVIEIYQSKGQGAAFNEIRTGTGKREMDEIRVIVSDMVAEEKKLLEQRRIAVEAFSNLTMYAGIAGVLVCLLILGTVYSVIYRETHQRIKTEESLRDAVQEMERHNAETNLVSRMGDYLRGCRERDEVYDVIATSLPKLFPQSYGEIAIFNEARTALLPALTWGKIADGVQLQYGAEDCWALRQGKGHLVTPVNGAPVCSHLQSVSREHVSFCLPMQAQGETIGQIFFGARADEATHVGPHEMATMRRITEQISLALANLNLQQALKEQSIKDPLTKLFNRRYLDETFPREISRAERSEAPLAVLIMDIDFFKKVNDTYGHDGGDAVLTSFAKLLSSKIRKEDIACRLGGEEFVLILPSATQELALARAEEICEATRRLSVPFQNQTIQVTVSIGVAMFPDHGDVPETLVQKADEALYEAKDSGRDRVVLYKGEAIA